MKKIRYIAPRYLFRRFTVLSSVKKEECKFLEVGAGNLELSADLLRKCSTGVAIDFQPHINKIYKQLPKKTRQRLEVIVGDFMVYHFKRRFDLVVSCEVMEHVEDDVSFMNRIVELTKPGGKIILSVPAKMKYWTQHDEAVGHYRRYERQDLIDMLHKYNFRTVKIYSYGFPFINILWLARSVHGKMQLNRKRDWSQEERTKDSGTRQTLGFSKYLGIITNRFTFFLPNLIANMFDSFNFSEGYVVVCRKK